MAGKFFIFLDRQNELRQVKLLQKKPERDMKERDDAELLLITAIQFLFI